MTNSKDAPKNLSPQSAKENKKNSKPQSPPKTTKSPTHIGFILLAFIAIACAFYAMYVSRQSQKTLEQQTANVTQKLAILQQQQDDDLTQIGGKVKNINKMQNELQTKLGEVDKSLQTALQQRFYQPQDWLLLKARYYLELAQINAHWSDDLQDTSTLLKHADTLLSSIHDQKLFQVRQAIAKEREQIQSIPKVDMTGLLSQLDAIQNAVSNLHIKYVNTNQQQNKEKAEKSPSTWRTKLKNSVNLLERLVVVRHQDEGIQSLLTPQNQIVLHEIIRMNLQEAQWAVLQKNTEVYQFALSQAIQNIQHFFNPSSEQVQAIIKQLQEMKKVNLVQKKPVLDQALQLLNQVIKSKNQPSETTAKKAGEKTQ